MRHHRRRHASEAAGDGGYRRCTYLCPRAGAAAGHRGRDPMRRGWRVLFVAAAGLSAAVATLVPARGQAPESAFTVGGVKALPEPRLAGLQWRFVRVKYHANSLSGRRFRMQYWGEPCSTDGPAADQNLTR